MTQEKVLLKLEGCVLIPTIEDEEGRSCFLAETADLLDRDRVNEVIRFHVREVPEEDRDLIKEGALFYYTVTQKDPRDKQSVVHELEFKRN